MNEIRAQAEVVAEAREEHAREKELLDRYYKEFEASHQGYIEAVSDTKRIMLEAESAFREIALAAYQESQDKHPGPGVEIKVGTKLTYEPLEALAWATEHGIALSLNVKVFESLAKDTPIPCVNSSPEPKATIATDLRKALENSA